MTSVLAAGDRIDAAAGGSARCGIPVRTGAVALWLAGPLLTAAVLPHPTILEGEVADVVRTTEVWGALHLMAAAGIVLGWWGVTCTVALHRERLRQWAAPIFAVTTIGAFVLSAVMIVEAFTFTLLARHAPETLELDGPIFASWPFRLVASFGGGFLVGLVMLGWALAKLQIWPSPGRALAVTAIAFTVFAGAFVPVVGPLSTVAIAAAAAWVGLLLWRSAPVAAPMTSS